MKIKIAPISNALIKTSLIFWFEIIILLAFVIFPALATAGNVFLLEKDNTSLYLIGSAHVPFAKLKQLPKEWLKKTRNAQTICFESSTKDPREVYLTYDAVATESGEVQSKKLIDVSVFNQAIDYLRNTIKIPEEQIARLSLYAPYYFADAFASLVPLPLDEGKSIDSLLSETATELGLKQNCFVETGRESLAPGHNVSLAEAENYLRYALKLLADNDSRNEAIEHDRVISALYSSGNLEAVCQSEIAFSKKNNTLPILTKTVFDRNELQFKKIIALTSGNANHVIAVGALHFCGPNGLIQRFLRAGYRVSDLGID